MCLYGTSGGGKTSLLNLIGTIDKPTKGELHLCDTSKEENVEMIEKPITHSSSQRLALGITHRTTDQLLSELRLHHIGFVFQTFNLLSGKRTNPNVISYINNQLIFYPLGLTALENVELPMVLAGEKVTMIMMKDIEVRHRRNHSPPIECRTTTNQSYRIVDESRYGEALGSLAVTTLGYPRILKP